MKTNRFTSTSSALSAGDKESRRGFTLVEVLVAMVVGLIILSAIYAVYVYQQRELRRQERITEVQQIARIAMEMMTRDMTMAGFGPAAVSKCTGTTTATNEPGCVGIAQAQSGLLSFRTYRNGANEKITYKLVGASLRRVINAALDDPSQEVVSNVQTLAFTYVYDPAASTDLKDLRKISISLTISAPNTTPYTLTSQVTPRNMALGGY